MRLKINTLNITLLFLYGLVVSCNPKTESTTNCAAGEVYSAVTQSCIAGVLPPNTVIPITDSVVIQEDSGQNQTQLKYEDTNDNLASSCVINSISEEVNNGSPIAPTCTCIGGICSFILWPIDDFFGVSGFTYTISNVFGASNPKVAQVIVEAVNDPPIAITPSDLKPDPRQNEVAASSLAPLVVDVDDTEFVYEIVNQPLKGIINLDPNTGAYQYIPTPFQSGADNFQWRAKDSHGAWSNVAQVNINIIAVDSPPTGSSQTATTNEDIEIEVTLGYEDRDGDPPTNCITTDIVNLIITKPCTCLVNECKVSVRGQSHYFTHYQGQPVMGTSAGFNYTIFNDFDNTGPYPVAININEVNDIPLALSQSVFGNESSTAFPEPFNFTLQGGIDYDNHDGIPINDQVLSYKRLSSPSMGTLTNCLDTPGSDGPNDLSCTYLPVDGNVNGVNNVASSLIHQNINLVARWMGNTGTSINYQLIGGVNPGAEYVEIFANSIKVHIASGITRASTIAGLINGDTYGQKLVTASVANADLPQTSMANPLYLTIPSGNLDFDSFFIGTNDTIIDSPPPNGAIQINIYETDDIPVICQYSRFDQAQECGILGCIGDTSPLGRITPSKRNLRFFDRSSAVCWVSTGNTANDWMIGPSFIFDQFVNEKDVVWVTPTKVDQGGGNFSENNQSLRVINVKSTDHNLIPPANVEFYFNFEQKLPGENFGEPGQPASNFDFRIKVIPQGGVFGNADISFDLEDSANGKTSVTFNVQVNNVSARHNGWKNLSAVGPKTDNFDLTLEAIPTCSYTQDKCSLPGTSDNTYYKCLGVDSPLGRVTPGVKDAIFLNAENGTCWINRTAGNNLSWERFDTLCNVSPPEIATECQANGSCVFNSSAEIFTLSPSKLNNFYIDYSTKECYRSILANLTVNQIQKYTATNEINLEWKPFTSSGEGSIEGYNVYRRLANQTFNYFRPVNRLVIPPDVNTYLDNGINSIIAPVPKTVYYYDVRPIINDIPTDTSEPFKTVRITSPPNNMVFAHRWIMNQRMCELLHSTNIDTANNFACPYIAPGEKIGSIGIYDIGQDLFIDRFEAGCPWTLAPVCSGTPDNACIGLSIPNGTITAPTDTLYYDRTNGVCYKNAGGGTFWQPIDGASGGQIIGERHRIGNLPPLVNVTQDDANLICENTNNEITGVLGLDTNQRVLPAKLPNRLQQMGYSFYHPDQTDFEISALETGLSLQASPKCNTSRANGLEDDYSETNVPDSNTFYTLPGSLNSSIRSLITGSHQTSFCVSAFGVQDHVGNVGEFTLERITCESFSQCPGVLSGEFLALIDASEDYFRVPNDPVWFQNWIMDGFRGPCVDSNADGVCDGVIGSWAIQEQNFGAGRIALPMGLPIQVDFPTLAPNSPANPYLLEIGPTNGITSQALHEDSWTFNNQNIYSTSNQCGAMTAGGNFNDSNGAGQFSFEFLTCREDATSYLTLGSEMAVRAIQNLPWTLEMRNPNVANAPLTLNVTGNNIVFSLRTDGNLMLTTTYAEIAACLNNPPGCICSGNCNQVLEADMFIGLTTSEVASPMNQTELVDTTDDGVNKREDMGFRCLNPIDPVLYIE